jgi:hypothetical protein
MSLQAKPLDTTVELYACGGPEFSRPERFCAVFPAGIVNASTFSAEYVIINTTVIFSIVCYKLIMPQ